MPKNPYFYKKEKIFMTNLLVSFKLPDPRVKGIIESGLGGICSITYIEEARDRRLAMEQADAVLSWNPNNELSDWECQMLKKAKFMQLLSAGADHVKFDMFPYSLAIAGNVGAYSGPMAEHVMAMALALAKNLQAEHNKLKAGNFDQMTMNKAIAGKNCAILGFGGIGKAAAKLMRAFGAKIFAVNTSGKTDEKVDFIGTIKEIEHVLKNADFIVVSMPLARSTRGLIGAKELAWMKKDAILVNVARGEIIDEKAFYEHMKANTGFKAGIDAWWVEPFRHGKFEMHYPFLDLPNVLGSPHNSAMVPEAMPEAIKEAVDNVRNFIKGEKVKGVFDRKEYIY